MRRIGNQLLSESRAAIKLAEKNTKSTHARDVLSILVRANTMDDLPMNQRLSDEDVLARKIWQSSTQILSLTDLCAEIPTFLVAGHETTRQVTTQP